MSVSPSTYHCLCTTHLLTTTHTLSSLPTRSSSSSSGIDGAIILPLPSPWNVESDDLPSVGYSTLHNLVQDVRTTIVRREDGFEKRVCWRCGRCGVVVGYEILGTGVGSGGEEMDVDNVDVDVKEGEGKEFGGKILYILPGGMVDTKKLADVRGIGEQDVVIGKGKGVAVFE